MMLTSSSLPPSTRHTVMGGASHLRSNRAFRPRCVCHPWRRRPQCYQVHAHQRSTARQWLGTRRRTLGRKSTAVEVGRTIIPPSSATVRGVETSRVTTSRETSTCMHQWVRAKSHMHLSPLAPREFGGGVHGVGPTPAYGSLAAQVPAPPTREVQQDGQPHRVSADLLHLHPHGRRE
jgi:hypothetical protein